MGGGLNIKYRILCVVQNVIVEQEYKVISDTAPTAVQRWTVIKNEIRLGNRRTIL
jgi:hypothetical protein